MSRPPDRFSRYTLKEGDYYRAKKRHIDRVLGDQGRIYISRPMKSLAREMIGSPAVAEAAQETLSAPVKPSNAVPTPTHRECHNVSQRAAQDSCECACERRSAYPPISRIIERNGRGPPQATLRRYALRRNSPIAPRPTAKSGRDAGKGMGAISGRPATSKLITSYVKDAMLPLLGFVPLRLKLPVPSTARLYSRTMSKASTAA